MRAAGGASVLLRPVSTTPPEALNEPPPPVKTLVLASTLVTTAGANAATTDEVRAVVGEMMADAQTCSSLLQCGGTAGHDGKFFITSADGSFSMKFEGQIQFRYIANFRDDNNGAQDDYVGGFQTRRTKLGFSGMIYDEFEYKIKGGFSRWTGTFVLEDAYVATKIGDDGWKLKWGRFKERFMRERKVSGSSQLAVDRSVVDETFNQDFSQGIELSYKNDEFVFSASFSDGFNSDNTEFNASVADWSVTGRVDWLAMGEWKQFKDFTSRRGSDDALLIGAAINFRAQFQLLF